MTELTQTAIRYLIFSKIYRGTPPDLLATPFKVCETAYTNRPSVSIGTLKLFGNSSLSWSHFFPVPLCGTAVQLTHKHTTRKDSRTNDVTDEHRGGARWERRMRAENSRQITKARQEFQTAPDWSSSGHAQVEAGRVRPFFSFGSLSV